jgi:hypothetical protein
MAGRGPFLQQIQGAPYPAAAQGRRTIDESVNDELPVLLHQVVDVSENATAESISSAKLLLLGRSSSVAQRLTPLVFPPRQQNRAKAGLLGFGVRSYHILTGQPASDGKKTQEND